MLHQSKSRSTLSLICLACLLATTACAQNGPATLNSSPWFSDGAETVEAATQRQINNTPGAAKNVILFIGDGMGISTVTAARILAGQQQGLAGEEYQLSFEHRCPGRRFCRDGHCLHDGCEITFRRDQCLR